MISTAIILAQDDKGLQPIFGIPAVLRLLTLLLQEGIQSIHLVGQVKPFVRLLSEFIPDDAFHQVEDPALLGEVSEKLLFSKDERVLILKANYVIDRLSLTRLMDTSPGGWTYFMKADGGNPSEGFYVVNPDELVSALQALWLPDAAGTKISDKAQIVQGFASLPVVVNGGKSRQIAEARLITALSFQTESSDSFMARHVDRRVSRFISKKIVGTRITPNQVTLGGMTIGLVGAFLLSQPDYWFQLVGSLLFLFCVVVDGVDGEIARLRLQETRLGHYLDIITDNIVHLAVFIGMAFGLYRKTGSEIYLNALWFLIAGFFLCAVVVYHYLLKRSRDELKRSPRLVQLLALVTNRDFAYLVAALAAVHRLEWFFIGSTIGTYLFAFSLWAISTRKTEATVS